MFVPHSEPQSDPQSDLAAALPSISADAESTLEVLRVQAESYRSDFVELGPNFYFFKRTQGGVETREVIDTFSGFWALAVGSMLPGQVEVYDGHSFQPVVGRKALWIPPYTLVKWRLGPGEMTWFSYLSTATPPVNAPTRPCMFDFTADRLPTLVEELNELFPVRGAEDDLNCVWLSPTNRNPIALKLKTMIDRDYTHDVTMPEYAKEIGAAHETMTRAFRSEFGLPPIQYRNRVRLFQAMIEILINQRNVNQASQDVGFWDLSHFNEQFKRLMRVAPSSFKHPS